MSDLVTETFNLIKRAIRHRESLPPNDPSRMHITNLIDTMTALKGLLVEERFTNAQKVARLEAQIVEQSVYIEALQEMAANVPGEP